MWARIATRYPVADAHVKQASANDNFGSEEKLVTTDKNNDRFQAYLRFDLTGINTVDSASLELYRIAANKNTTAIIYAVAEDSWTEGGITWNNQPPAGPELISQSMGTVIEEYKMFDITGYAGEQADGDDLLTVLFTVDSSNNNHEWWARERGGLNEDPRLVLSHSNVPDTPSAPLGLIVTSDPSASTIHLSWTNGGSGETGFLIERSPDGISGWTVVGSTAAGHTNWSDTGLEPGTNYTYRVRAENTLVQSGSSNPGSTTTAAPAVTIPAEELRFARNGSMLEFRFPSEIGVTYQLQQSGNLLDWSYSGQSAAGSGGETVMSWPEPTSESRQFYRIVAIY